MKKHLLILLALLTGFSAVSCVSDGNDPDYNGEKGSISISPSVNLGFKAIETRADENVPLASFEGYKVTLTKSGEEPVTMDCPSDGVIDDLEPGEYTLRLFNYPDDFTPAFETPLYSGTTSVSVSPGANPVSMTLTQANAGVYFIYDLDGTALEGVIPTITQTAGSLTYEDENYEAKGYFTPGTAEVTFDLDGDAIAVGGAASKQIALEAGQLWQVTLKMDESDGSLSISATIDTSVDTVNEDLILDLPEAEEGTTKLFVDGMAGKNVSLSIRDASNLYNVYGTLDANGKSSFDIPEDHIIVSIFLTDAGTSFFVGRMGGEKINLKVDESGNVILREAVDGYIPLGSREEISLIKNSTETLAGKYKLEGDLRFESVQAWTPIGSEPVTRAEGGPFTGEFDGDGHTISRASTTWTLSENTQLAGFFGLNYGTISNLHLDECRILINSTAVSRPNIIAGGICAMNGNLTGKILNCSYTRGNIEVTPRDANAECFVGGICGVMESGLIQDCKVEQTEYYNGIKVSGTQACAGGLVGSVAAGYLMNNSVTLAGGAFIEAKMGETYNAESLFPQSSAGGIAGNLSMNVILNDNEVSMDNAKITGTHDVDVFLGGIAGSTGAEGMTGCSFSMTGTSKIEGISAGGACNIGGAFGSASQGNSFGSFTVYMGPGTLMSGETNVSGGSKAVYMGGLVGSSAYNVSWSDVTIAGEIKGKNGGTNPVCFGGINGSCGSLQSGLKTVGGCSFVMLPGSKLTLEGGNMQMCGGLVGNGTVGGLLGSYAILDGDITAASNVSFGGLAAMLGGRSGSAYAKGCYMLMGGTVTGPAAPEAIAGNKGQTGSTEGNFWYSSNASTVNNQDANASEFTARTQAGLEAGMADLNETLGNNGAQGQYAYDSALGWLKMVRIVQ